MTATLPGDAWAPVMLRYELVRPGDIIAGKAGPLMVARVFYFADHARYRVDYTRGHMSSTAYGAATDPVPVLVPLAERESIVILREGGLVDTVLDRTG